MFHKCVQYCENKEMSIINFRLKASKTVYKLFRPRDEVFLFFISIAFEWQTLFEKRDSNFPKTFYDYANIIRIRIALPIKLQKNASDILW